MDERERERMVGGGEGGRGGGARKGLQESRKGKG